MFEQINSGFVKGETYYVKKKGNFGYFAYFNFIMGDLLFDDYNYSKTGAWFDIPHKGGECYYFELNDIIIYRYITKKEYFAKVKEKYDSTCLNIVLKRLVNETFEW